MPLSPEDQDLITRKKYEGGADSSGGRLLVLGSSDAQKLRPHSVACTILNRTIGSGIFVTPALVLRATGSVGSSLLIWTAGAVISMSALLVWLELGLSIPKFDLPWQGERDGGREGETRLQPVPRSGGEKNYLEYIYRSPKFFTTCLYAVVFVTLGNLAGNSIAFGTYILRAAGIDESDERHYSTARGLAVACMTASCLLHGLWRKGGIVLNNILAIFKVCILLAIIGIGFRAASRGSIVGRHVQGQTIDSVAGKAYANFDTIHSFAFSRNDFASYANSILYVVYTYSGYEQPFYILNEVHRPKRSFKYSTIGTMILVSILFVLVNVSYLCVVSYDPRLATGECLRNELTSTGSTCQEDMASVFFGTAFGPDIAPRVMSGILALSIFGNIVVMTFTASRVKQEIAKEGILPYSLFWARNITTPWARAMQRFSSSPLSRQAPDEPERSPAPALLLHWIFAMMLIAFTSFRSPDDAYRVLVTLYSYTVVLLLGFFVSAGLLYLRWFRERETWVAGSGFKPWGGPTAAVLSALVMAFLIVAPFVPPKRDSAFFSEISWYIVPTVGLRSLIVGVAYYMGLMYVVPPLFKKGKRLVADREAVIVKEHGEYVQYMELVDAAWETKGGPDSDSDIELKERKGISVVQT